jgi:endonuclease/exonuclease/phosphatase family metal-dependent hydrolase
MKQLVRFLPLCWLLAGAGCTPGHPSPGLPIAFYNCENLFDTVDNPNTNDDEFTPGGLYHYTQATYEQKLHNIATVLQSMGYNNGQAYPALIGLAEVENAEVLRALTHQPELERMNYQYTITTGHDKRGINVGLLYDSTRFRKISESAIGITSDSGSIATRDILYVCGTLAGDTVHIFVNHWPSRRNDSQNEGQAPNNRLLAAQRLKEIATECQKANPGARIIVMGDFNDNPPDSSITHILGAQGSRALLHAAALYNPFAAIYSGGDGTENYRGCWNLFDQIIVSAQFMNSTSGIQLDSATIYKPNFITEQRHNIGAPRRSFIGTYWANGYSDHFPVMVYLSRH